jgi:hypothetical protein
MSQNRNLDEDEKIEFKKEKFKGRCAVLPLLVNSLKVAYNDALGDKAEYIEALVNAGISYIPRPDKYWTGYISVNAVKSFEPQNKEKPKLREVNIIPRNFAVKQLLNDRKMLKVKDVEKLLAEKFCKVHYVTPKENTKIGKYQKPALFNENKARDVFKKAKVELVRVSEKQLDLIRNRDKATIDEVLKKTSQANKKK